MIVDRKQILMTAIIAGIIRDLPEGVPSGPLYIIIQTRDPNFDIEHYNAAIDLLIAQRAVKRSNHLLTWLNNKKWNDTLDSLFATLAKSDELGGNGKEG